MPLRSIIKASPETLSDMLFAADDRYREAEELLRQHRFDGCVYLLGYAAEMWLKSACFRLRSIGPTARVMVALPPLRLWMRQAAPHVLFTDWHDLAYLAQAVIQLRIQQRRPLPPRMVSELQSHVVNGIHSEWLVDMRYRRSSLSAAEAWAALVNTWWVSNNWVLLT
jgi:hypothetical protein